MKLSVCRRFLNDIIEIKKELRMKDIMLVEDDTMIASGILYALETEGYEVCHATTVADAHDFIEKREFHLAIIISGIFLEKSQKNNVEHVWRKSVIA